MAYRLVLALALGLVFLLWSSGIVARPGYPGGQTGLDPGHAPYPASVESMIERREDQLQRRREDYLDWHTGRRWHQAPWVNARRDWMDAQQDAIAEGMRRRRDAREGWRDAIGWWRNPRSQWHDEWSDARRNAHAMDRLNREEHFDRLRFRPYALAPWGGYW